VSVRENDRVRGWTRQNRTNIKIGARCSVLAPSKTQTSVSEDGLLANKGERMHSGMFFKRLRAWLFDAGSR
jgi:hypothetical protein